MKNSGNFFVRVNYSIEKNNCSGKCTRAYIRKVTKENEEKYLIGGGYFNKNRGSFVFKARDLKEANDIAQNNIFVKNKLYRYELIILDEKIPIA
ncbi:hypothetical protein [Clostridium ganghwense]|uniref:YCII-related domain-containing protein n=1 Tax=Clostridium ganghwense TaxID=312089 RepID=A0ABT4CV36_9CLOT|nr:hypothetical protein [Clostridium ganghwense]MCY6372086.1 hypothetical protein [Clostridium ganghwense]